MLFGSLLLVLGVFLWPTRPAEAAAGINEQLNFQGRLLDSTGAIVADGNYNMRFKIYQDGDGALGGGDETLQWTEERKQTNRVVVKNGYFSVNLGSVTAFGSNVDWNQDTLWLSIDIGGTADTATPTYDGEMDPFRRLTSNPYALNSGRLGGLTSSQFVQLAQGLQTDSSTANASIAINKTGGTANILQLQRGGADVLLIDNAGELTYKPQTNSTTALEVKNAAGTVTVLNVDTTNTRVGIGTASPSVDLEIRKSTNFATSPIAIKLRDTDSGVGFNLSDTWGNIEFHSEDGSTPGNTVRAKIGAIHEHDNGSQTALAFYTSAGFDTQAVERLRITTVGNLNLVSGDFTTAGTTRLTNAGALQNITSIDASSYINSATGFRVNGAATTGNFLRGNGTNFVSSAIQAGDIPDLGSSYIKNQTGQQASSNFNISGTGIAGVALQAPAFDTAAAGTLTLGGTNATGISLGQSLTFTGTAARSITGPGTGALSVVAGSGAALTLTGNAASTWSTASGALTIQGQSSLILRTASTGAINIGTNANAKTITIGNNTVADSIVLNGTSGVTVGSLSATTGTEAVCRNASNILSACGNVTHDSLTVSGDIKPTASPTAAATSQTIATVDSTNTVGVSTSITISNDGNPIVAYLESTTDVLKVAHCGNKTCTAGNTLNTVANVQAVAASGSNVSLALGGDGYPVISYRILVVSSSSLNVVKCGDESCSSGNTNSEVDSTGGLYSSLTIGTDGNPIIAYYDDVNDDLKVAKCGNSSCSSGNTLTTVDSTGDVGQYTSIAIGTDGLPIISYYDATNADLKIVKCGNISCSSGNTITVADSSGDVGSHSSIAIGKDGLPVLAYYYERNNISTLTQDLRIRRCQTTNCSNTGTAITPDTAGIVGLYNSVSIGNDGIPIVSYYDSTNGDLKTLKCANTECDTVTGLIINSHDTSSDTGKDNDIVIGTDGLPVISYYDDGSNDDLKTLKCADPACKNSSAGAYSGGASIGSIGAFFNNVYAAQYWGRQFQIANFDLAEEYPVTDETIEAGDVVALSSQGGLLLERATMQSKAVFGIVSTQPGLTLGDWPTQDRTNLRPIGLAGRVPCKVTTENGDINIGDRLTISSTSGVAMKYTGTGPVVGVAMEAYAGSGTGKVMTFITNPASGTSLQGSTLEGGFENLNVSGSATIANLTVTGTLAVNDIVISGHIVTSGTTPEAMALEAAGQGAHVDIEGNDISGVITSTTGKNSASGLQIEVKFNKPYAKQPKVILTAVDATSSRAEYYAEATNEVFRLGFGKNPELETTYRFHYFVIE